MAIMIKMVKNFPEAPSIYLSPFDPINIDFNPEMSSYMNVPGLFYASKFTVFGAQYQASISPIYLSLRL